MENNAKKALLTQEEIEREKQKKQLAIIKASNEMLQYAKDSVMNSDKIDDLARAERVKEIEDAMSENILKARTYLHATPKDVENSIYKEASEEEKLKYEERLKKRGITEESLNRMDMATISTGSKEETKSKRKHTVKKRKRQEVEEQQEDIVRLPNEDELMHKSMATSEKIEEKLKKNTKQEDAFTKNIKETIEDKKVKSEEKAKTVELKEDRMDVITSPSTYTDFDFSSIEDGIQYDVIPLPSKGKCYPVSSPLRSGVVPVSMITASDENIIASPNMYRDGKIIDVILERKILDKRCDYRQLCQGDRDAIVLWLRATGYDTDFPIVATHPDTGKKYDLNVKLNELKYKDFNLESDAEGNFTYTALNGDIIKFNFMTHSMEEDYKNKFINDTISIEKVNLNVYLKNIEECLYSITDMEESDIEDIRGCLTDIKDIINESVKENLIDEKTVISAITDRMIAYTVSINGNTDRNYIKKYIENMRSNDAYRYRNMYNENIPGVDFKLTVNVPESDGGGSFTTFLKLGNDVFLNI